jgi:hypothetical protein
MGPESPEGLPDDIEDKAHLDDSSAILLYGAGHSLVPWFGCQLSTRQRPRALDGREPDWFDCAVSGGVSWHTVAAR